ncbi:MAG: cation:proton antiporter [Rhodocyclaceae bacterium]|nr:cation:proton antiporter [Rhodocyclaceae bacterium]MDZ4213769.1 cation:proton antiporter [Rhodocyclaceae bacterium]
MSLLTSLLILIVAARLLGSVFTRFGQPAMIGEMLAGILLGPAIFGVLDPSPALAGVAELAVFLVILSAGLEMRFDDIVSAMKGGGFKLAVISFSIPFLGGVGIAWLYELDAMRSIFLGLCISITALPVAAKILENLGLLDTPIGRYTIATAIINDVAAMMVLGMVLAMPHMTSLSDVASSLGIAMVKLVALIAMVLAFNHGLGWLERRGVNVKVVPERLVSWFGAEALFGIVVLFVLIFGSVSEALGFHFVIGAFFGALLLDKRHFLASRYDELKLTLGSLTGGFLAPVFFAYLGLEFDMDALKSPGFVIAVLAVSIFTKVFAGMWGGQALGMSRRESLGLGFMLNGRGVMELVVASIAYQKGFIGPGIYSTLVLMGVVTTMLTPWLFSRAMPESRLVEYRQRHAVNRSESV